MVKILIDEEKCDGCGLCIPSCHEGVLEIVDGKARVVRASLCDGMGACVGECPKGAITMVEEKEAPVFSCPSSRPLSINKEERPSSGTVAGEVGSELRQWPVQLHLVSPNAAYFKNCDLLVAADCTAFSHGDFHRKFLKDRAVVVACPKLDQGREIYVEKLAKIFKLQEPKSVTVLMMEVPCCSGLLRLVREALALSGKKLDIRPAIIGISGEILDG